MRLQMMAALAACAMAQQAGAPRFDVASVKRSTGSGEARAGRKGAPPFSTDPTRLAARRQTLRRLIARAYGVDEVQVTGGPAWMDSDLYDIDARVEKPAAAEAMLTLLQSLLAERFQIKLHRESKEVSRYVLAAAKNGPKFGPQFHPAAANPDRPQPPKMLLQNYTMDHFAFFLYDNRDRWEPDASPVLNRTGLQGAYDIVLNWASRQDWLPTLEHDLGLKLELRKIPSETIVIDGAAKPDAN